MSGETLDLERLRARGPVVLDVWATWCKPCLAAVPEMDTLWRTYRERGLTVIGVSEDGSRNRSKVLPFATRVGISYPIVLDADESLQRRFQVRALPTSVLIGRDGRIVSFTQGYRSGETAALEAAMKSLLDEAPNTGVRNNAPDSSGSHP